MQNWLGVIFAVLFLVSCGQKKAPVSDPRFDIYKIQFQTEATKRGVHLNNGQMSIPIAFGETGAGTDGLCVFPSMGTNAFDTFINDVFNDENYDRKFVLIDPSILEKDLFYIEAVVFHELAHCLLKREHTDERSLMNVSQERNGDYPYLRKVYLDELFGLDADFEGADIYANCSSPKPEDEIAEDIHYSAFGRELEYILYPRERESREVFCVQPKLK